MCNSHVAADYLRGIRGDGCDPYSNDKYILFQSEYGDISDIGLFGIRVTSEDDVHRSSEYNYYVEYFSK